MHTHPHTTTRNVVDLIVVYFSLELFPKMFAFFVYTNSGNELKEMENSNNNINKMVVVRREKKCAACWLCRPYKINLHCHCIAKVGFSSFLDSFFLHRSISIYIPF